MFTVIRSHLIKSSSIRRGTRQKQHFSMASAFVLCAFLCPFTNALAAQEPFVLTNICTFTKNDGRCKGNLKLPEKREAVIEFATAQCTVHANGQPTVYFNLIAKSQTDRKNIVFHLAPSNTTERPQSTLTTTTFTHETRIYLHESSKLTYEFQILNSGVGGECDLTLQGK